MIRNAQLIDYQVDPTAYHRQPQDSIKRGDPHFVMSRSELMTFWRNPWKWLHGVEDKDSTSTDWGSLLDTLMLDYDRFGSRYVVAPEEYPSEVKGETVMKPWNWNATYCKEWRNAHKGKTVLKKQEEEAAWDAHATLTRNDAACELVACSKKQVLCVAEWADKATGLVVPVKILLDLVPEVGHPQHGKRLADFKTAVCADPNTWLFVCNRYGYHVQAAFYMDIYTAATGEDRTDWVHLVQENTAPYCVELIGLDTETVDAGRTIYRMALAEYCQCLKTNQWRSYYVDRNNASMIVNGVPIMKMIPQMQAPAMARMTYLDDRQEDDPVCLN